VKDFNKQAARTPKVEARPIDAKPAATKAELLARLAQRPKPAPQQSLEPNGSVRTIIKSAQAQKNEMRIREISERLTNARTTLRQGFARTKRAEIER
jgi:hypothetical protein